MAEKSNFTITVSALDKATATLRAIKKELGQTLDDQPVVKLGHSLGALAHETGLPALGHHAISALGEVAHLGAGLVSFLLGPLKSIVGLIPELSLAGLIETEKSAAESAAKLLEAPALESNRLRGCTTRRRKPALKLRRSIKRFSNLTSKLQTLATGGIKRLQSSSLQHSEGIGIRSSKTPAPGCHS
jgi:hypothetical protein